MNSSIVRPRRAQTGPDTAPMPRQPQPPPIDGALVVQKPRGRTSHDVVEVVRRLLGFRQIGHLGTLDPLATGVLVLLLGRATRLARFYSGRLFREENCRPPGARAGAKKSARRVKAG